MSVALCVVAIEMLGGVTVTEKSIGTLETVTAWDWEAAWIVSPL